MARIAPRFVVSHSFGTSCARCVVFLLFAFALFFQFAPPSPAHACSRTAQLPSLQAAIAPLAAFVGARVEDMVFITNATAAMNCMFDAVPLSAGDECVCLDIIYPAVRNALAQRCERAGAKILQVKCSFPLRAADDVVSAIVAAIDSRPHGRVKMLCIDHVVRVIDPDFNVITFESSVFTTSCFSFEALQAWSIGALLPIADIAAECRKRDVLVCVDGAHAVGQVLLSSINWPFVYISFVSYRK